MAETLSVSFDGLDGFDGLRQPSNTVKELSNQASKLDSNPSSRQKENAAGAGNAAASSQRGPGGNEHKNSRVRRL